MKNYILDGKTPKPVDNFMEFARWYETADRHVKRTELPGGIVVSTVFLGLDHRWHTMDGPPILFETMIFGGDHDEFQNRYSTWEEAEKGHEEAVSIAFTVKEQ
jgi:hypothetical protein